MINFLREFALSPFNCLSTKIAQGSEMRQVFVWPRMSNFLNWQDKQGIAAVASIFVLALPAFLQLPDLER